VTWKIKMYLGSDRDTISNFEPELFLSQGIGLLSALSKFESDLEFEIS
jgi:hypothetical protein